MWLWGSLLAPAGQSSAVLHGARASIEIARLNSASVLPGGPGPFRGRSVVVATPDQLTAAIALIELDGVARRMVLCPPDLPPEHLTAVAGTAQADAVLVDDAQPPVQGVPGVQSYSLSAALVPSAPERVQSTDTEWILLTSGTTGVPKLVQHSLASLTSALLRSPPPDPADQIVWSTFYDIRRYGGLQIFLRGLRTGALVLSAEHEPVQQFLARAASGKVTHISGTPSHWRRALMSGAASTISPRYVRLSGEIADQAILDALKAAYPRARVAHAFASTEAGVAFEVTDGLAGFPLSLVGQTGQPVEMRVDSGTLQIRSAGAATRYLGEQAPILRMSDGFVDTGDRLELRDGRYHFVGRSGGVINVGGLKVHPEEIEAVINAHPWVSASLVRARRSPITGAMVTAEVVLAEKASGSSDRPAAEALTREILEFCRQQLASHKVPTMIRIVPSLAVSASGKLIRPNA